VGRVEAARGKTAGCRWPGEEAELLTFEGQADVAVGRRGGTVSRVSGAGIAPERWAPWSGSRWVGALLPRRCTIGLQLHLGDGDRAWHNGGVRIAARQAGPRRTQGGASLGSGSEGSDNRAVLWEGSADRWFDLNALLPGQKYNASIAWAIEIRDDAVRLCSEANRYEAKDPGTPYECHVVPVAHPVLWTARLSGG
jgi:hypothetical protein